MQLANLQKDMTRSIRAFITREAVSYQDFDGVFANDEAGIKERIGIYQNNYTGSLVESLRRKFPIIEALTGEEFARTLFRSYIAAHPLNNPVLDYFGADMPSFIDNFEPVKSLPYLPDIARMEWAEHFVYSADDDQALSADRLATIDQDALPSLQLNLRHCVQLVSSPWPLMAIKDFCEGGDSDQSLDLSQGGVDLLIYRDGFKPVIEIVDRNLFDFLSVIHNKSSLGEAAAKLVEADENFDLAASLQFCLNKALVKI